MRFHTSDITEIKSLSPVAPKTGYILPFSAKNMFISQGYCGPWSHAAFLVKGPNDQQQIRDDRYALDFALPIGTEVIAAKDGRVLSKAE